MNILIEGPEDKDELIAMLTHQCVNLRTENANLKDATTVANNEAVSWKTACGNEFDKAAELEAKLEAMQEQEPVAWTTKGQIQAMDSGFNHYIQGRVPRFVTPGEDDVPLYTHPQPYDQQALEPCPTCGWKAVIPGEPCLVCERNKKMAQPERKPLSLDEIIALVRECGLDWHAGFMPLFRGDITNRFAVLVQAVETRHGIKEVE